MLWKYKKVYQERNEEVTETNQCYKLIRFSFVKLDTPEIEIYNFKYKRCPTNEIITQKVTEGLEVAVNDCLFVNSMVIQDVNLGITTFDVDNAISTNAGEIVKTIIDYSVLPPLTLGDFTLNFENCVS